jgi:hypothetical protein
LQGWWIDRTHSEQPRYAARKIEWQALMAFASDQKKFITGKKATVRWTARSTAWLFRVAMTRLRLPSSTGVWL